jgi:cell division protein FtsI/penicillin-binding protein 2
MKYSILKNVHFSRFQFTRVICSLLGFLVVFQVARIQTSAPHQEISKWAGETFGYETKTLTPERGNIYDRKGNLLAGNMIVYEIGLDLQSVVNPNTIAEVLSPLIDKDYRDILAAANIKYDPHTAIYAVLKDNVRSDVVNKVKNLQSQMDDTNPAGKHADQPSLGGVVFTPHLIRSYPEYNLASNILGFYSFQERQNARGYYGIEGRYDQILTGTSTQVTLPLDPYLISDIPAANPGASLVLTINRDIQAMVESVLDDSVERYGAVSGTIIVMNPKNGEILALASTPQLNLNEYWKSSELYPQGYMFNRAIGATYEPGSVFKIITMAAALNAGVVTPTTPFLDTGYIEVGGVGIYNWDRSAWGPQDMTGCLQHSLNVCLAWVSTQLGSDQLYQYLEAFGIGRPTNIDLSGEQYWPLSVPGDPQWYPVNLGTNAFGQGVAVTPIQMAAAISAVANGGRIMAPHVVAAIIQNGQQYNISPQVIASPIKEKTAKELTEMLSNSLEGESSAAVVQGYRLAGKTGTAQIPIEGRYTKDVTNVSFAGWGPSDDPQFLVYVWLEKPSSSIWASETAAPTFHDVTQQLVVLLGIPPDPVRHQLQGK